MLTRHESYDGRRVHANGTKAFAASSRRGPAGFRVVHLKQAMRDAELLSVQLLHFHSPVFSRGGTGAPRLLRTGAAEKRKVAVLAPLILLNLPICDEKECLLPGNW